MKKVGFLFLGLFLGLFLYAGPALGAQAIINFQDNSTNESGFVIERQLNGGAWTTLIKLPANVTTHTDTTVVAPTVPGGADNVYCYRAYATNVAGNSTFSNTACKNFAAPPIPVPNAPSNMTTAALPGGKVDIFWRNNNKNQVTMVTELTRVDSTAEKRIVLAGWRAYFQDTGVSAGVLECYSAKTILGTAESLASNQSCATGRP